MYPTTIKLHGEQLAQIGTDYLQNEFEIYVYFDSSLSELIIHACYLYDLYYEQYTAVEVLSWQIGVEYCGNC